MKYVLGIDLGTSGTKTVLFDQRGTVMASATVEYPMDQPKNGWAEQNPADWWNAAVATIRTVLSKSAVNPAEVVSLGISGQMHGMVMLDEQGEVLRPSIIWCDQRTQAECDEITERVGAKRLIEITANPALTGFTGNLRQVPPHSAAEGLRALYADRRLRHGGFRCQRYAAAGCAEPLLERRGFGGAGH